MRDLALHQSDSFCQSDWSAESFCVPSLSKVIYLPLSTSFTQKNRRATLVLLPTDTFLGKQKKALAGYNSKLTTNRIKIDFLLSMIDLLLSLITQKMAGIFWCNYPLQKGGKTFGALFVWIVSKLALILKRDLNESVLIYTKSV